MNNMVQGVFGAVLGALYAVFGTLQIVAALTGPAVPFVPASLFGGFVLLVIGAVLLTGVRNLARGLDDGIGFVNVGTLLSVAFGAVTLLAAGAGALEAAIAGEAWSVADALTPAVYLAVIGAAGFLAWCRAFFRGLATA
ncbi:MULTISPECIES: hypothetical protein [unclassified Methanoculleus]|uniref:hypothetical protein n=1 Tax=unclassified Methanoculleus TaxID=2619537 RepID=UPI0025FAEB75|nr:MULTISPECIES: hypothetical protein [unclassified Methanoculleus]MCK9317808.1 hypothetical protein [Methanoculleus sp.]MDD2255097.1 hypothetical protein [Methanoculleus sp.]MDD2788796.1 hypothetical protein [Methanoculleus sp.]MDD3217289.1 hypothetical protein [Methanoculleus sp.]MDD4315393.1 hypothetical protein [Methanoculleus sp.]